jgi:hypothetical protein
MYACYKLLSRVCFLVIQTAEDEEGRRSFNLSRAQKISALLQYTQLHNAITLHVEGDFIRNDHLGQSEKKYISFLYFVFVDNEALILHCVDNVPNV